MLSPRWAMSQGCFLPLRCFDLVTFLLRWNHLLYRATEAPIAEDMKPQLDFVMELASKKMARANLQNEEER